MTEPASVTNPTPLSEVDPVYVPVVGANYLPEGITRLEGYVPPANGGVPWDTNITQQKDLLEAQGLEAGPSDDNAWVDPDAPAEEEEEPEPEPEPVATSTSDTEESPEETEEKLF